MTVKNYFQKSNFGQEEKAEVQNENFHHVILSQFCLVLSLSRIRFQILPNEKGNVRLCSLTLPYSAWGSSWNLVPSEKSQVWQWNSICQDWLQLWAQCDAFASLQKLSAKTCHLHWDPTGETEYCEALGCLIKTEFYQMIFFPLSCAHLPFVCFDDCMNCHLW